MFRRRIAASITAISVAMPVTTAPAWAGADDIAAGIIGGIIGGAIANQGQQRRRATTPRRTTRSSSSTRRARPAISAAQRQTNRDVQTALNFFGFDAGGADGVLGRRSRAAIGGMQAFLTLPSDGTLTDFERDILLGAHARAVSGNPAAAQIMAGSPLGARAVLQDQYARATGIAAPAVAASTGYAGLTPDQLLDTATICLGSGYRTDDLDVAMGSALLLVALGSDPHAELLGHHLNQGFGGSPDTTRASAWYGRAIEALNGGAAPVFAGDQPGRTELLVWAAGSGDDARLAPAAPTPTQAVLPTFLGPVAD